MRRKAISSIMGTLIVLAITLALGGLLYLYSQGLFNNLTKNNNIPVSASIYPNGNNAAIVYLSVQNTGNQVVYINKVMVYYNGNLIAENTSVGAQIPAGQTYSQYLIMTTNQAIVPGQSYTIIIQGTIGVNQPFSQVLNVVASGG